MDGRFVRLDSGLMAQLIEYKRLTSIPVQTFVQKAVELWLKTEGPPILEAWGVTAKQIDAISHLRYSKEPKNQKAPNSKKALA